MKRLRILYDFEAFSDQSQGGISRYVLELAKRVSLEADICLYAGVHRSLALREVSAPWIHGCYFRAWRYTGALRRRLNAMLTRRAIARFQPHIVHRTYYRHAADYPGPHRDIVTLYDFTYFRFAEQLPGGQAIRKRMHEASQRADHLICISQRTRLDAGEVLAVSETKTSVIHLAVNPVAVVSNVRHPLQPYFLFVGQRAGYKNFEFLLQALGNEPALSTLRLLAFGGAPFTKEELATIDREGLGTRVSWSAGGDVALDAAYAGAVALIYPSLYEGFGLPPLEAMARGCPVVCSNRGSLPEISGDAALMFDPTNFCELRQALRDIVTKPNLAAELRAKGLRQAARFSWDRCANETLALYRAVVG